MTCGFFTSWAKTSSHTHPVRCGPTPSCGHSTKAWKRIAIVSDADWLEHSVKAFGWLIPGEIKVFDTDDVDDAKEWLVGLDEDDD
jgi:hypothetical protein